MSRPPAERPRRPGALMAYQAAVILPFLAFAVWAGWREPDAFRSPMLLLWLVAIAIVDLMPLTFGSNLHFSLSFPLQLAVALVYPAHVAGAVTFLGTSDPRELRRELSLVKALFIRAQIAVSVVAEGWIFHALADIDASWYVKTSAVALATVVG
ncbi:MAG: hypothetical protein HY658_04850, partial [Actinobacteria bacterium]|nr:hypothetical protein [Actinomycetota bacterium]